jgi:hypothetical protein
MGQELACTLGVGGKRLAGKAQLESDHILFRGQERIKLAFADLRRVAAREGVLELDSPAGAVSLELGRYAEKWAEKILHPPTLLDKLGVKPGVTIALTGAFDESFRALVTAEAAPPAAADLILYSAPDRKALARVAALASRMRAEAGLWIVYPKGAEAIRQDDVLAAGRAAGLKDVKVASFSATHTALKFVIPVTERERAGAQASR